MRQLLPWELDLRSLGAFRIFLGLAMSVQIIWRLVNVQWWYSPDGFAGQPVRDLVAGFPDISPFAGAGAELVVSALVVSLLLATMLTLGIYARAAAWALAVIFGALQVHHPAFLGNELMVMLWSLIWAGMLPIDRAFSVRRRQPLDETTVSSAAALGLTVQVGLVYTMNGMYKDVSSWETGGFLREILAGGMYSRPPLSEMLLALPDPVLNAMTWGVLQLERIALPVLLIPSQWARLMIVAGLMAFHVGSALTMSVGLYPLMSLAWLTALLPPLVWGKSAGVLPAWKPLPTAIASITLVYVVWVNIAGLLGGIGPATATSLQTVGLYQAWNNFTRPDFTTGVPVFLAQTAHGPIDLYRWGVAGNGTAVSMVVPNDYNSAYGGSWWNWFAEPQRRIIVSIVDSENHEAAAFPARYLCRKWNAENPDSVVNAVQVIFVSPEGRQELWKGACTQRSP